MPPMSILSFLRRTKSRYVDDKAVDGFEQVAEPTGILTEEQRLNEAAAIIGKDNAPTAEDIGSASCWVIRNGFEVAGSSVRR